MKQVKIYIEQSYKKRVPKNTRNLLMKKFPAIHAYATSLIQNAYATPLIQNERTNLKKKPNDLVTIKRKRILLGLGSDIASDISVESFIKITNWANEKEVWNCCEGYIALGNWKGLVEVLETAPPRNRDSVYYYTVRAICKINSEQASSGNAMFYDVVYRQFVDRKLAEHEMFFLSGKSGFKSIKNCIAKFAMYGQPENFMDWLWEKLKTEKKSKNLSKLVAFLLYSFFEYEELIRFTSSKSKNPKSICFEFLRGHSFQKLGETEKAIQAYLRVIELDWDNVNALLLAMQLSLKSLKNSTVERSIEIGAEWIKNHSYNKPITLSLLRLFPLVQSKRDTFDGLVDHLITATSDPVIINGISQSYKVMSLLDESLKYQLLTYNLNPETVSTQLNIAGLLSELDFSDNAIDFLQTGRNIKSMPEQIMTVLGHILAWTGNVDEATIYLKACLLKNPKNLSAISDFAFTHELSRKYSLAYNLMLQATNYFELGVKNEPALVIGLHLMTKNRLRRRMIFAAWLMGDKSLALSLQKEYERQTRLELPYSFCEWEGESFVGKKVVALAELGIGDEIRYASVFSKYFDKSQSVLISCDPRLLSLFKRSFPNFTFEPVQREFAGFKKRRTDQRLLATSRRMMKICTDIVIEKGREADVWVRTINLFEKDSICTDRVFQSPESPVLTVDQKLANGYRKKIKQRSRNKKVVGLSWRGGRQTYSRTPHYFTLSDWDPILENENYCFVNLQYNCRKDELEYLRKKAGDRFIEFPELDLLDNFEGLAALTSELDLIIAICTAILELAGAVGSRVLYLMPFPQATHAIRLSGYADKEKSYQDSVWKTCRIIPKFNMSTKELVEHAAYFMVKTLGVQTKKVAKYQIKSVKIDK